MESIKVLVFKPGKDGEILTFIKNQLLLEEAIKEKKKDIEEYIEFKSIYSKMPRDIIKQEAEKFFDFNDEEKNYDFIIHKKLKKIIGSKYSEFVSLYNENIGCYSSNRVGFLIGENSAIEKRDKPNRGFYGTIVILKYNYKGFIVSLNQHDIDILKSTYNNIYYR